MVVKAGGMSMSDGRNEVSKKHTPPLSWLKSSWLFVTDAGDCSDANEDSGIITGDPDSITERLSSAGS